MRILPLPPGATAHQIVQTAYGQTAQLQHPRGHRFLHHAIPGLPIVQLCIWGGLDINDRVVPFLTQDARRPVCTARVAKEGSAFEAALTVETACGFGPFLHLGLQRRQIHMACNGRPIQPHSRWALQFADFAGFSIGPVPGQYAPLPSTRWASSAPVSLSIVGRQDITDGDADDVVIVHRHGHVPVSVHVPHSCSLRQLSGVVSEALGVGMSYSVHLPLVAPLSQGTPVHCLALAADHPRPANAVILDMRHILCPPTPPFITVEAPPIVSFPAIVHGIQSMGVRHRPITAAYLNDELIGACNSLTGAGFARPLGPPVSYGPLGSPGPGSNPSSASTAAPPIDQTSSYVSTPLPPGQHFSAWNIWDQAEEDRWQAAHHRDRASTDTSPPQGGSGNISTVEGLMASGANAPPPSGFGSDQPCPGQRFSPWNLWDEAEEQVFAERQRAHGAESAAPPWSAIGNYAATTEGDAAASAGTNVAAFHPALNPSLPAGWPTEQSFAQHCNLLHTLDPRVLSSSFTLFDVVLQVRILPKPRGAGEIELRDVARSHCRHLVPPVYIHMLEDEVPGFPSPQFTAFAGQPPLHTYAVPLDLRPAGWGVCVAPVRTRASLFTVAGDATTSCAVNGFSKKVARQTLTASSRGRGLPPFAAIPVDTDHIRFQRAQRLHAENSATTETFEEVVEHAAAVQADDEAILGHIDAEGFFHVVVHAPGCQSSTIPMHRFESPHVVVRRASNLLLPFRPHTTVHASWPIEQPRSSEHLLHLMLEFDRPRTRDNTMFLVDCRGLPGRRQEYVVFCAQREMTAGELFACVHEHVGGHQRPAFVLVNNRPLRDFGVRRYSLPLVRLLSREQFQRWQSDPDACCPAIWSTSRILRHLPCFYALTETFEASLQRRFGSFREQGRGQSASLPAVASNANLADFADTNSSEDTERADTTTTTTAGPRFWPNASASTTTTSTSVASGCLANPYDTLQLQALRLHLFSCNGDVLTSTVRSTDLIEVLLFKMCRSLRRHHCLVAGEEFIAQSRVYFSEAGGHLLLCTRRPSYTARCWAFAPQWHPCPLAIRCDSGLSRAGLLHLVGISDGHDISVTINGCVVLRSMFPKHGDVVVVQSSALMTHSAPLMVLLNRLPDVQALLFRHEGPSLATADDEQLLRRHWQITVRHCQHRFGLQRPGVRATLVSNEVPCMVVCLGTLVYPSVAQIQEFYNCHLADRFGRRFYRDTGQVDGDRAPERQRAHGAESAAPPWSAIGNYAATTEGDAAASAGTNVAAFHPALNPSLPAGWPTEQSFAQHCNLLHTLDPRVLSSSFTLFDVVLQVRILPKPRGAGEIELRDVARSHCRHLVPPVYIHMLEDEVPGFPSPQFTAFAGQPPLHTYAVPLDLRPAGWGVCVAPVRTRASLFTVAGDATTSCAVNGFSKKVARQTLTASSRGRGLPPFAAIPVDTDHIRFQRAQRLHAENSATTETFEEVVEHAAAVQADDEAILGHIDAEGFFHVVVHAPGCQSSTIPMHRFESPHVVVRRASNLLLPFRPHTTVHASWPIEQPRSSEHLLHLMLEFDRPRTRDNTMFLVDCRGLPGRRQEYVVFCAQREMTAGELFACVHEHVGGHQRPAFVLVNNRPLRDFGVRRYSLPLVRLLSREQFQRWQSDPDACCPAIWSTSRILRHLPCFYALTETFEASLQRRFGSFREQGRGQSASLPAVASNANLADFADTNSSEDTERADTTTTTTAGPRFWPNASASTTTTSTSVASGCLANPYDTLQLQALRLHLFSCNGDVLTSTVRSTDLIEVLLFKMCRSLRRHHCLVAGEEFIAQSRVYFSEAGGHLLLCTRRPSYTARCWAFAPQWHPCPLAIRCDSGLSRAGLLHLVGISDGHDISVTINGCVVLRSMFPKHGDVVVVQSSALMTHSAPLMVLLNRLPDVQALLFRHEGPSLATADDEQLLRRHWQITVRHCQHRFGLQRPGVRATLVSNEVPCMVVCLGTLVYPSVAQIQEFYNCHLADRFGRRFYRDTGQVDGDRALLFEPVQDTGQRLWIIRLPHGVDVRSAASDGSDMRGVPLGNGWCIQPILRGRRFGLACTTRRPQIGDICRADAEALPGHSDDSEPCEFVVPLPGTANCGFSNALRQMAADVRRMKDEGLVVAAPDTPPEAFNGRPPPPLTDAQAAAGRTTERVFFPDLEETFPVLARIARTVPSPTEGCDETEGAEPDMVAVASSSSSSSSSSTDGVADPADPISDPENVLDASEASSLLQLRAERRVQHIQCCSQPPVLRTIPTPCRALRHSAALTRPVVGETTPQADTYSDVSSEAQTSPAEQSADAQDCNQGQQQLDQAVPHARTSITLNLEECIPHTCQLPATQLVVPATVESFYEIVMPMAPDSFRVQFLDLPGVHSSTRQLLHHMPLWQGQGKPDQIDFFVDGSYYEQQRSAGWAVVRTVTFRNVQHWGGFMSGCLHPAGHSLHVGQTCDDPHTAELIAMLYAMAAALNAEGERCHVHYDAQAAASIAQGEASSAQQPVLARGLLSLRHLCQMQCSSLNFEYVAAHQGHALNEAADTAAKAAAAGILNHQPRSESFASAVRECRLDWLWWPLTQMCHEGRLPYLGDQGATSAKGNQVWARRHSCQHVPGIPRAIAHERNRPTVLADWRLSVATYNCTTLVQECDRQTLCRSFTADAIHVIGLQETRTDPGPKFRQGRFCCICSAAVNGQLGCQLWLDTQAALARDLEGCPVRFKEASAAVLVSTPRLLVVTVLAGNQLFAFVVGHAPISAAPLADRESWWQQLEKASRQLPRRALPIWLLDANARFAGSIGDTAMSAACMEDNASMLQSFANEQSLDSNQLHDKHGQPLTSWTSPVGKKSLLEYVLFPAELAAAATTVGIPPNFVDPVGFDHSPITVCFSWKDLAKSNDSTWMWNREAMRTAEGRLTLQGILASCPAVPWSIHPDDHLQIINDHIFINLCRHFPPVSKQARKRHVSDEQWEAVRLRRHARRLVFRNKQRRQAYLLHALFQTWRLACSTEPASGVSGVTRVQRKYNAISRSVCMANARLGRVIRTAGRCVNRLEARDAAAFTRKILSEAKEAGPAELAHSLRGVLKHGRKYKPPRVAPTLLIGGEMVSDPLQVTLCIEDAFAAPEQGHRQNILAVVEDGLEHSADRQPILVSDFPSLAQIADAFLSMKNGKAPGLSTFPAEIYRLCAIQAAELHMPLVLKSTAVGALPALWRGSLAVSIPKPNKPVGTVAALRSIALFDAAAKGLGRALRKQLSRHLQSHAMAGQHGTQKGDNLLMPAQCVQSYLQAAAAQQRCCAILFMDGKHAYYSVLRQILSCKTEADYDFLESAFQKLGLNDEQQLVVLAAMRGSGEFDMAGVPPALEDFLRKCLRGTWFTMFDGCHPHQLIHTRSGTVPGTPLADVLFAFVQARFQRTLQEEMHEAGISTTFATESSSLLMPSWADDVAILLPMCGARDLVSGIVQVVVAAEHHSRATGIQLNFDPGKTEVVCAIRGPGSRRLKRELLAVDNPGIPVNLTTGQLTHVRLVQQYVHLGSLVTYTGSTAADAKNKPLAAIPVFRRLKCTLLRNPALTPAEKSELVRALVVAKVGFASALWCPVGDRETHATYNAFSRYWRQALRQTHAVSSKFLTDAEVCEAMGALQPRQFLAAERVRQLNLVLAEGPGFLWRSLIAARRWLDLAFAALAEVSSYLEIQLGQMPENAHDKLVHLRNRTDTVRRLPSKYTRAILHSLCPAVPLAKALAFTKGERRGWTCVALPPPHSGAWHCSQCSFVCSTKAALAVHLASRHNQQTVAKSAAGSVCPVCCTQWWTTYRLREHLRRSKECCNVWTCADLDVARPFERVGSRKDLAWQPPATAVGPMPFWSTLRPPPDVPVTMRHSFDVQAWLHEVDGALKDDSLVVSFLKACRLVQERPDICFDGFTGPAAELARLCMLLTSSNVGDFVLEGRFQCQLEERHKAWVRRA